MKHAGSSNNAKELAELLAALRQRSVLREKSAGIFYVKSTPFLHFHEDPTGVFADVKLDRLNYSRYRVSTATEQAALLKKIDRCLAEWSGASRHVSKPDPALESLKDGGWRQIAAIDQALADGRIDEAGWHEAMASLIKPAYLAADNPYAQAGHSGNAATWEASRGFIADAIHRSGTFLDVGCASGILMESVQRWGAAKEFTIEPHGVEIIPEFVQLARRRLPRWADRIHGGNIRDWRPAGDRFDFVLIRPEYAPVSRRADLVRHVVDHVLTADGRLIVLVGNEETEARRAEATITSQGFRVDGRVEVPHPADSRLRRRLFWIDAS